MEVLQNPRSTHEFCAWIDGWEYCRCYGYQGTIYRQPRPIRVQENEARWTRCRLPGDPLAGRRPLGKHKGEISGEKSCANNLFPLERPLSPQKTDHVPMTSASLRALTKTGQSRRMPLPKVSFFMYKTQPATAPPKAPPKTFPFGERRPGRRNPTKETPSMTSRYCDGCSLAPTGGPRPRQKRTKFGRQNYRQCGFPSRLMSREGEPGGYIRRLPASTEDRSFS